jgi:hypothetical protein
MRLRGDDVENLIGAVFPEATAEQAADPSRIPPEPEAFGIFWNPGGS